MKQIEAHVKDANTALVQEVRKHRALYDITAPGYSMKEETVKGWDAVADKLNLTGAY